MRSKKSAIKKKRFGRECTDNACIGKVPIDWIGDEGNTGGGGGEESKTVILNVGSVSIHFVI